MANLAKIHQRFVENLNNITRETPCKVAKLTRMANLTKKVNLAKMEGLLTICRGLANILVGWQKGPLGEWRF